MDKPFPPKPELTIGAIYQHYKGGLYVVTDLSCDEATHEWRVTYEPIGEQDPDLPEKWNRLATVFLEQIALDGISLARFEQKK